jgi:hypothetical protein
VPKRAQTCPSILDMPSSKTDPHEPDWSLAPSGAQARQVLALLLDEGKLAASDVQKALKRRDRLIRALRASLAALEAGAVGSVGTVS